MASAISQSIILGLVPHGFILGDFWCTTNTPFGVLVNSALSGKVNFMNRLIPFFLALLLVNASLAHATIFTWSSPASGSWHTATNWSPNGLPGAGDTVNLTNNSSFTVSVTNGALGVNISSLTIGGAATLVVSKASPLVAGFCVITNGGTLVVSSNSILTPSALAVTPGGSFVLDSSATLAASALSFTNAGSVFVNNLATFTVSNCVIKASGTFAVDGYATLTAGKYFVNSGGALTLSNAWMPGTLTVAPGGTLNFAGANSAYIYSLTLTNNGTVNWSSGSMSAGGTMIYNAGLWQITGNNTISYGGGGQPVWVNAGTLRKSAGTGVSSIDAFNFQNPGGVVEAQTGTLQFNGGTTNFLSGVFSNTAPAIINFINGVWTDAGGFFAGTSTNNFSNGTFNLRTNVPPGLRFTGGDVWVTGANTFQNSGAITNLAIDGAALRGTNVVTGTLTFNTGSIPEKLTIATNGQLVISSGANKLLYGLTLINQGTVLFSGSVNVGSGGTIFNSGLWQIIGDVSVNYGGNAHIVWTNTGIIRKTAGSAISYSQLDDNFLNLPGGLVECLAGRLILNGYTNSQFGGTFNALGLIDFANGVLFDAGGVATGTGTNRFISGTLNLRTNVPSTLLLAGGTIFITGTNTFQNAGAITNLSLDGATLGGTNIISGGTLTMNSGALAGQLLVQPDGQILFATSASKFVSPLTLSNRGTVTVNGVGVSSGTTVIVNSGLWQMAGDFGLNYGGVGNMAFTNSGTFRKTSGSGTADNSLIKFFNQPGALVQVDSGTLQLPVGSTNFSGTLRLNGGTLNANGNFAVAGGTLDGAGTFGANVFSGGTVSPGNSGAGQINFSAGLNLNSNVTLVIDGTGPVPGVSYDSLSVTGTVTLANCNFQITALPTFPAGTTFTLINNDGADAVSGTFAGLPENSPLTVGAQSFRIHYAGGTGNDVTLVRDGVVTGPTLALQNYTNNAWTFTGTNAIPLKAFTVRASTNLLTWTNIGVVTSSVSGAWIFTDTNAWRYARRFYNTTN